jgi:ABC-type glycerol-3-phosphate transport system permease component
MAGRMIGTVPLVIMALTFQRLIVEDLMAGASK